MTTEDKIKRRLIMTPFRLHALLEAQGWNERGHAYIFKGRTCARLQQLGYMSMRHEAPEKGGRLGYWITAKGRAVLRENQEREAA